MKVKERWKAGGTRAGINGKVVMNSDRNVWIVFVMELYFISTSGTPERICVSFVLIVNR